jgi:hypothetical protein
MLDENAFISFSQRIQKNIFLSENTNSNLFNLLLKSKKDNNSEKTNESFDFIEKPLNIFNKIEKPKEIITKNYNDKNIINNFEKKVTVRPYHQFIENIANKKIYIKKKLLEQILQNKKIDTPKMNNANPKFIKLSKIISKQNVLTSDISTNEYNINKSKQKNEIIEIDKTMNHNKTYKNEKIDQINSNKIALLKKLKFDSLKKFCKNVKLSDKKLGINFNVNKGNTNKNEIDKNNCDEIKINTIKEKVRNYFIGKFNNIKEYFDNWDEQKTGKINVNDMYNYLNKKIKYKISKQDTAKLLYSICNKNYLDLNNFRIIFFENEPKERLFIKGSKFFDFNESLLKKKFDINQINKSENNLGISFFEKFKYNEIISLILKQKNIILSQIKSDRVALTFVEFYMIVKNVINEKKYIFDKEIKKIFNDYKDNSSDLINIYDFFEKISINEEIKKNNSLINIKRHINSGIRPPFNKNKSSFFNLNSRNTKKNVYSKESTKTNFFLDKVIHIESETKKKNNIISLNKFQNMRKNLSNDLDKLNSKLLISDLKKNKNINNEYPKNITNENSDNSKLVDFQLPSILNHERNKNKNSDIIEFL